jgi:oxygen-independent coproporphyrinogen-3 oxidase
MTKTVTNTIRRLLVGKKQNFVFSKFDHRKSELPKTDKTNLYVHIPFCKSMCPYCPYNRVRYQKKLIKPYIKALLKEIELYHRELGDIEISSIYIGGGTPTNAINELEEVIAKIKNTFNVTGDIAIETTISDINKYNVKKLRSYGVNMISVGVQNFNDNYLKLLGRNYTSQDVKQAINILKQANFDTINIDLMFALPEQTENDILHDIKKSIDLDVDQITTYPLFTFPYSTVGEYLKVKKIKMPSFLVRRKFYKLFHDEFLKNGYSISSVWGFTKNNNTKQKYSSVTRDNYIGLGAGAGSRHETLFYFNTFSIREYCNRLSKEILPIAINMPITKNLSHYYWLYWRLYEANFSFNDFNKHADLKMKTLFKISSFLGLCNVRGNRIVLPENVAFWVHVAQNYFMLNYINKVWSVMKKEAFPKEITI